MGGRRSERDDDATLAIRGGGGGESLQRRGRARKGALAKSNGGVIRNTHTIDEDMGTGRSAASVWTMRVKKRQGRRRQRVLIFIPASRRIGRSRDGCRMVSLQIIPHRISECSEKNGRAYGYDDYPRVFFCCFSAFLTMQCLPWVDTRRSKMRSSRKVVPSDRRL